MPRLREEQRVKLPQSLRARILRDTGYRCAHCNTLLPHTDNDAFSIEHVVPLRKGGGNNPRNLIALCKSCNKEKQDDIIEPREYYKHAPAWKLEEVCKTFDDYIENTDWLAYDTLFKLDRFELHSNKAFLNQKSGKIFNIPAVYQVQKMRRQEVSEYLTEYTGHLATEDKCQMGYEPDEITTTYYKIMGNGETIMVISPYILETDFAEPNDIVRKAIFLDVFVNFNIRLRPPASFGTIGNILQDCLREIRTTIDNKSHRDLSVIDCIIRTPKSDVAAANGIYMLKRGYHNNASGGVITNDDGSKQIIILLRLYNGTREDLANEAREAGVKYSEYHPDIQERQDNISERLAQSREITREKIKHKTKKEKKASKKKQEAF